MKFKPEELQSGEKRKLQSTGTVKKVKGLDLTPDQDCLDYEFEEDKEETEQTSTPIITTPEVTKPTRFTATACRQCEGCTRLRCDACMECKNPQHKKKCLVTKCRKSLSAAEQIQLHKDWTKSIQSACQQAEDQLRKDIETRKAVASITSQERDDEGEDFRPDNSTKTKNRIAKCAMLLTTLGKSDVNIVNLVTKVLANTSKEEQKKEKKNKSKDKYDKNRKPDKSDNVDIIGTCLYSTYIQC